MWDGSCPGIVEFKTLKQKMPRLIRFRGLSVTYNAVALQEGDDKLQPPGLM
jgi:hypothetical protein